MCAYSDLPIFIRPAMGPGNDVNAYQDVIVRCQEKENIPSKSGLMGVYPRQTSVNVKYSSRGAVSAGEMDRLPCGFWDSVAEVE